ncbi:hypothetical protein V2J09_005639 [Rumex salicifolius]
MASLFRIRRFVISEHLKAFLFRSSSPRLIHHSSILLHSPISHLQRSRAANEIWKFRNFSHGTVNLVISDGKPKFETQEFDPPKKEKWKTKKKLKMQRMREKKKRMAANKKDPRRLTVKGKKRKQKFANPEERIKYKLEKARIKETLLIERLEKYEVSKLQGPMVQPHELTGEQRFYLKKMGQKASNYVPVGRRGIFGGVILNMHMHWKKHETVKVIGDDTMIFYRGKNYVQPEIMSPIDTLSKKKALEKSKYEQSLESVRHFIAVAEKELELYYRHIALYGNPNCNSPNPPDADSRKNTANSGQILTTLSNAQTSVSDSFMCHSHTAMSSTDQELSETENELEEDYSLREFDSDDGCLSGEDHNDDTESKSSDDELSARENEFKEGHSVTESEVEDVRLCGEDDTCHLRAKREISSSYAE